MTDAARLSLMNDPAHWQKRAHEARTNAELIVDADARRTMLAIADNYERLAARALERTLTTRNV